MTTFVQADVRRELVRLAWMMALSLLGPGLGMAGVAWITGQKLRWTVFFLMALPMGAVQVFGSVRRIQLARHAHAQRQFGLGSILAVVSLVALWLTVARADWMSQHRQDLLRRQLQLQIQTLVGQGRVQLSTDSLFVQVQRPEFDDGALRELIAAGEWARNLPAHFYLLDLSGTQVTDAGILGLSQCSGLEFLYLDGTRVTAEGLKVIGQLPDLQLLSVNRTKVTTEELQAIQQLRPQLQISPNGSSDALPVLR